MKKLCLILAMMALVQMAGASWYWPFGGSDEPKPPRISELMETASQLIEVAVELAVSNRIDEAVFKYQQAVAELDRLELENPERAQSSEFSTVRLRRQYCNAAIDSLLLDQAKKNAKSVAVTDTTALEQKRARMLKAKKEPPKVEKKEADKSENEADKTKEAVDIADKEANQNEAKKVSGEEPSATNEAVEEEADEADEELAELTAQLAENPRARGARLRLAAADLAKKDYDAAMLVVNELLTERLNDASALNLKAAIEVQQGKFKEAEKTLNQCINSNPRNYYAYYNMADLVLTTRENGKSAARRYYESGRAYGGPVDEKLEERLK